MCLACSLMSGNPLLSGLIHDGAAVANGQIFYADFAASTGAAPTSAAAGGTTQGATGIQDIDGVLSGQKWDSTHLTFMFSTRSYFDSSYYDQNALQGFQVATAAQQTAARADLAAYAAISGLSFTEVNASAITGPYAPAVDITIARSTYPGTAYAYYPYSDQVGGDVWLGINGGNANPVKGNYAWHTMMHEFGHSLGLKHGHETGGPANVALPTDHDSMEFSVMTYRAYPGAPLTGYTNETYGFAQSLMMDDIAAIQAMYGANFTTHAENTTYSFSPTTGEEFINGVGQGAPGANRVFMTIWDGGGTDTYDFSNYTTDQTIDLTPGGWSVLSAAELANLGSGHFARGNVFNALQYNGDVRSLIENANGGSGNDTITGNAADNVLSGGAGNDIISGGSGNDTIFGNMGNDVVYGNVGDDWIHGGQGDDWIHGGQGNDTVQGGVGNDTVQGGVGNDIVNGNAGNDILYGNTGSDTFVFDVAAFGQDIIMDFEVGSGTPIDHIQFSASIFANYAAVISATTQVGADVKIQEDASNYILLKNVDKAALHADHFIFV